MVDDEPCTERHQAQTSATTVRQFTRLVSQAFELMADANIVTAQDFMGCQKCAAAALEQVMREDQHIVGYVFYDRNDADCLDELG